MSDYLRRLEALEDLIDPRPSAGQLHLIVCEPGETSEQARTRYFATHQVHPAAHVIVIQLRPQHKPVL